MSHHNRYTGHTGPILDVQFSRTGSLIASSSRDSTVRLWVPDLKGDSQVLHNLFVSLPHYYHGILRSLKPQQVRRQCAVSSSVLTTRSCSQPQMIRRSRYLYFVVLTIMTLTSSYDRVVLTYHISCYRYGPWRERSSSPQ